MLVWLGNVSASDGLSPPELGIPMPKERGEGLQKICHAQPIYATLFLPA
jgi:hypothetical protein